MHRVLERIKAEYSIHSNILDNPRGNFVFEPQLASDQSLFVAQGLQLLKLRKNYMRYLLAAIQ